MDYIWEIPCPICRNKLSTSCVECATKRDPPPCPTKRCYWSTHHVYHTHCIDGWLKERNVCPLDNYEWKESPPDILTLKELCIREISCNIPLVFEYYHMIKDDITSFPPDQVTLLSQLVCHPGRRFDKCDGMDSVPEPFRQIFGAIFTRHIPSWKHRLISGDQE